MATQPPNARVTVTRTFTTTRTHSPKARPSLCFSSWVAQQICCKIAARQEWGNVLQDVTVALA